MLLISNNLEQSMAIRGEFNGLCGNNDQLLRFSSNSILPYAKPSYTTIQSPAVCGQVLLASKLQACVSQEH